MNGLTERHLNALRLLASQPGGWCGPRPGYNFWPRLYLDMPAGEVEGDMVRACARLGLIIARPTTEPGVLDAEPDEDFPGVDLDHDWELTVAGRAALAPPASKEDAS